MIELFPYNQKDYEAMRSMLEKRGRAGVVKPPSEGKAMLGMHLAEEEPNKLVLWVNPNTLHIEAQKGNAIKQSAKGSGKSHDFSNVVTLTYSALMEMAKTGELPVLDSARPERKPDYIILDEVHHAGAPEWGKGVDALLAACPQAQVIGFTATPIRHQDGGLDMMEKLFKDAVAVNLTVIDSWNDPERPLEPPAYVRTYYSKEEELENIASLREQAEKMPHSASGRREKVLADIDKLSKYVEDADGVDEVMQKRITEPDAKVIVFCKNKEHLYELASPEKVREWFGDVNEDVHVYPVESSRDDCLEMLDRYTNDESGALKVLYAIDMFNESLHVKGCRYAVMARPTESPNIWLQQMGRVFEKDKYGRSGVVIDLARNYSRAKGYVAAIEEGRTKSIGEREITRERDYIAEIERAVGSSRVTDVLAEYSELVEDIRENLAYTVMDHLGQEFKTKQDMCEAWGIEPSTFRNRMKIGLSLEEALTSPVIVTTVRDHTGHEFKSQMAMCEAWGIDPSTFRNRIIAGLSLEEALTLDKQLGTAKQCIDHLGNIHPSEKAMCKAWGVTVNAYRSRRRNGYSLEEALTAPVKGTAIRDHTGHEFKSEKAMCREWGISNSSFRKRIDKGWSLEEALTTPQTVRSHKDHLGNVYPTEDALCEAWGLNKGAYRSRIKAGWTLEEALTGNREPVARNNNRGIPCIDHTGQSFPSQKAMCVSWNIDYGNFRYHIKAGWTLEEALTGVRKTEGQESPSPVKEEGRKPGELKQAAGKPKQSTKEKATPRGDEAAARGSAAARRPEGRDSEKKRKK